MDKTYSIQLLTPCFCRGMDNRDDAEPEIRPASIRGHLRSWHRALFADPRAEKEIFGGVGKGAVSSPVIVRVANIQGQTSMFATLPHKEGGRAAKKKGFSPGTTFELLVSTRRGGISDIHQKQLTQSIDAWLLAGGLGLRTTRAAGAIHCDAVSAENVDDYQNKLTELSTQESKYLRVGISKIGYQQSKNLRRIISSTPRGYESFFGSMSPRRTSLIRMTIKLIENNYHLVACFNRLDGDKEKDKLKEFFLELYRMEKFKNLAGNLIHAIG